MGFCWALIKIMVKSNKQNPGWGTVRTKGQTRFVLTYGILLFGVPFAILSGLVNYFREYSLTFSGLSDYLTGRWFYVRLLWNCLFFGCCMGLFYWYVGEWYFKRKGKGEGQVN